MGVTEGGFYMPSNPEEAQFLANYDTTRYAPVAVTADIVLLTIRDGELCILLIKRGGYPFKGAWALPGGFLNADTDLTLKDAALRELLEETDLQQMRGHLEQLGAFGDMGRDPRVRVVSIAYLALLPQVGTPVGGDDAAEARFIPVSDVLDGAVTLAFDHIKIVRAGVARAQAKLEYTPLATVFCGDTFTLAQLRRVYETVWGEQLNASNFRRKVLSSPGFVQDTETSEPAPERGGRAAQLYRAGGATMLWPPMLRREQDGDVGVTSIEVTS